MAQLGGSYLRMMPIAMNAGVLAIGLIVPTVAFAQQSGILPGEVIPITDDRGRNIGVNQRSRPGYQPTGIRLNSFTLLPTLNVDLGATNNVRQVSRPRQSRGYAMIAPTVSLRSNWGVHAVRLDAGARLIRYFGEATRNENGYFIEGAGKLDISTEAALSANLRTARQYESRFSSTALDNVRTANPYQVTTARALLDLRPGRNRFAFDADVARFDYATAVTFGGTAIDQNNRNRNIYRFVGHAERNLTPDTSLFVEGGYVNTDYDKPLALGIANRDSQELRGIFGVSVDINSLIRGNIGVGYLNRNYRAPLFKDISGFSFLGRIEYFATPLTTVTINFRREIADSTITNSSGFFINSLGVRADHELLRNFLLNINLNYEHDKYRGIDASNNILSASGGGRYYMNQFLSLRGDISYSKRDTNGTIRVESNLSELRGMLGIIITR